MQACTERPRAPALEGKVVSMGKIILIVLVVVAVLFLARMLMSRTR